jgi:hypothetical protein
MGLYHRHLPGVSIDTRSTRVRIIVPTTCALGDFFTILGVALAGSGVVLAMVLAGASHAWHESPTSAMSANMAPWLPVHPSLAGGTVLALAIVLLMLGLGTVAPVVGEMLVGCEVIDINEHRVAIRRRIGPWGWKRVIPCERIAALRDVEPPHTWRRRVLTYRPMWHGRNGMLELALDDGRRVRFATVEPGTNHRLVRGTVRRTLEQITQREPEHAIELPLAGVK